MRDIKDAIARTVKHLAEIGQVIVDALEGMTPEQRAVIEFLAENPKVAEAFQELNQKLAKQKAIGGAIKETAQLKEPLLKDYPDEMRAVRAYGFSPLRFQRDVLRHCSTFYFCSHYICFDRLIENLKDGKSYTIAELCGDDDSTEPLEPTFVDLDERIREKEGK